MSESSGHDDFEILEGLYREAQERDLFVMEFNAPKGYLAAVGDMSVLDKAGVTVDQLGIGDVMNVSMPGAGDTRAAAVRQAMNDWILHKINKEENPDGLILHGAFTEGGFLVKAFMPSSSTHDRQWTIEIYADEEDEIPLVADTAPMLHEPIFGPDVGDVQALEDKVDELIESLNKSVPDRKQ